MLKILHTGDLHLDAAFASLDERRAQIRKNEMRAAFTSMMTYARMNGVDAVVFAGDVFDGRYVTRETVQLLCSEFEKFGGIVCIAAGNHDYADTGSVWRNTTFPDNVHLFLDPTLTSLSFPEKNLTVWGYGFSAPELSENPLRGHTVTDPGQINLLLCHSDMNGDDRYAPLTGADLTAFGADYTALGHIHNPPPAGERWAYCGCLEGRDFSETGPKGACVVEIEKNGTTSAVRMKRVRFSKRRYETGSLDITGCTTMADVRAATADYIAAHKYGEDTLLQLRYTGIAGDGLVINSDLLGDMGLFCCKIQDKTMPDLATLSTDPGIRGALYRTLAPALSSAVPEEKDTALRALRYGLAAIAGENIVE